MSSEPDTSNAAMRRTLLFTLAAIASFCWFMWLSGALHVEPGSRLLEDVDYLLSADIPPRVNRLSEADQRGAGSSISHPLLYPVWAKLGGALHGLLGHFFADEEAKILAVRSMVAAHAALGFAFLLSIGGRGASYRVTIPLAVVYLLSTSQVLMVLPEHMGISAGLLAAAFAIYLSDTDVRWRAALLIVFGLLLAGVTITNGAFALVALALLIWTHARETIRRWRRALLITAAVGLVGFAAVAVTIVAPRMKAISSGDTIAHQFWNGRILSSPGDALAYIGLGLVYPVVGPDLSVSTFRGHPSLTYEPLTESVHQYRAWQAAGAVAWVVLLLFAGTAALRDERTRMAALLLLGWFAGNATFHNFWGDEYFLYTTHWTWALFALTLLGAKSLTPRFVLPTCAVIAAGQIAALVSVIHQVERSIGL
jgi:hypothetical protein